MRRPRKPGVSLVVRLVLLFAVGSAFIMAGAGYSLYHALRMRLEANDVAEVTGKTEVVQHLLRDATSRDAFEARLPRLRDITVGHPQLSIGVISEGRWLVPLSDPALSKLADRITGGAPQIADFDAEGRSWVVHRIRHAWSRGTAGEAQVVLAVETTETHSLLKDHAIVAWLVALVGTLASTVLAWFVANRGLRPLAQVAARAEEVTASRLGARLDLEHAPRELHGLAESINGMLQRLEESFSALEQFSADIAHELRTPLNNLLLQTQVTLSRTRTADDYRDALHSNLEELERLQRMISDMLFLARADRGMIRLDEEEFLLAPEIESVAEYFEAAAAERGQRISRQGEGKLRADRMLFRRVLNNLLSNAVRYSPAGSNIVVKVDRAANECRVAVSNPGSVPESELRRLFARFARRESSRGREVEGAGLGLAIVESIMKLQRGTLEVSSDASVVSFELRFPAPEITKA